LQHQDVTISAEQVRLGDRIEEILGRNRLSPRQAIIWGRSWRRITAIILARRKLHRHGVMNLAYITYEWAVTRIMSYEG